MTPEQQRIAIAAMCGWTQCQWNGAYDTLRGVPPVLPSAFQPIPDYLNDLNAMHEAEKTLTLPQKVERIRQLYAIRERDFGNGEVELSDVLDCAELSSMFLDCSPAQRAEAFLRTLNLYTTTDDD